MALCCTLFGQKEKQREQKANAKKSETHLCSPKFKKGQSDDKPHLGGKIIKSI